MDINFIIYIVIWAILGILFHFLGKRASDVKTKKKIDTAAVVSIFALMYIFIFMQSGAKSWPIGLFLLFLMFIALFISNRYTSYCQACSKRIQHLGQSVSYCPKCGGNLIK